MTSIEHLRTVQDRIDTILTALRERNWSEVWRLFRALLDDVERAKQAAYQEETTR
jgi:hypothetical protein